MSLHHHRHCKECGDVLDDDGTRFCFSCAQTLTRRIAVAPPSVASENQPRLTIDEADYLKITLNSMGYVPHPDWMARVLHVAYAATKEVPPPVVAVAATGVPLVVAATNGAKTGK